MAMPESSGSIPTYPPVGVTVEGGLIYMGTDSDASMVVRRPGQPNSIAVDGHLQEVAVNCTTYPPLGTKVDENFTYVGTNGDGEPVYRRSSDGVLVNR